MAVSSPLAKAQHAAYQAGGGHSEVQGDRVHRKRSPLKAQGYKKEKKGKQASGGKAAKRTAFTVQGGGAPTPEEGKEQACGNGGGQGKARRILGAV